MSVRWGMFFPLFMKNQTREGSHCNSALTKPCKKTLRSRSAHAQPNYCTSLNVYLVCYLRLQEIPESGSSLFLFIFECDNNKAPAEPHLDVCEQGLYGGQAFREDEGSVVETCWELLSCRVRRPLAVLPAWWGFLVDVSVAALLGCLSRQGAVLWKDKEAVWCLSSETSDIKQTSRRDVYLIPTKKKSPPMICCAAKLVCSFFMYALNFNTHKPTNVSLPCASSATRTRKFWFWVLKMCLPFIRWQSAYW